MPLHTGFHPTCAVAFCPIYDTARQNFASKVRRLSWENHLFRFTYCAMDDFTTYSHKFPLPIILTKSPTHTIIRIHFLKDIGFLLANHSWHFAIHFLK